MKIEFWIITFIAIVFTLATLTAFVFARTEAANKQVLTDITQIAQALKIYYDENGGYPAGQGIPEGINLYLDQWPVPSLNGNCSAVPSYYYTPKFSENDFSIPFCLSKKTENFSSGMHTLTSK